ncbi:Wadjet anti-phage system protein JetA family protein [uncultured Thalassolituus sp.]|uniref:Wadjet anti-phage system protein JetA family protein n=1 Tax=uncultured Thalassolituus sp. TaxID=285273 RepID=UPI00263619D8|nr:Wadjet anti-phage system protein JetA family protein [uncultured Thalassolituus sp.]
MFFDQERGQFFRPLTGKYRAQVMECLRELYQRLYSSSSADYGQSIQRDTVVEIFQEALVRAPVLADGYDSEDDGSESRFRSSREQAGWVLNQLLDHGWLEKQVDEANLQSTFAFTRYGRQFTEPFISETRAIARTRHRNTRNTRNSLESFLDRGDIYDLLDAYEYSERIISDFTDVIAELEERKRDLVREMEDQMLVQRASEAFFDFMENRFQPDLSVRLSADNVEKHRDQIQGLITGIRKKDVAFKATAERRLRELLPDLTQEGQSVLWSLLDGIELRLRNASDIMLPALRRALQSFTKRADIIIRQMSYLASQQHNDVLAVCRHLADLPEEEQASMLERAGELMSVPQVRLVDPAQVRLAGPRQRQKIEASLDDGKGDFDVDARREIYVQQVLDQAFLVNQQALRQFMASRLSSGRRVSTRDIPIESAKDFLAVAHAIGLGAADGLSSEFEFRIDYDENPREENGDGYFIKKDHFTFELVQKES